MRTVVLSALAGAVLAGCLAVDEFPARFTDAGVAADGDATADLEDVPGPATDGSPETTLDGTSLDLSDDTGVIVDDDASETSEADETSPPCRGATYFDLAIGDDCDGIGECGPGIVECTPEGDIATCSTNPDGSEPRALPELCNGLDDDCDGRTDQPFDVSAPCTVGEGQCRRAGTTVCRADGSGTECLVDPAPPALDDRPCDDDDPCTIGDRCAGEACVPGEGALDADGDGHVAWVCPGGDDCDDGDDAVYPGAPERCDAVANDCDTPDALEPCLDADGDGYCADPDAEPSAVCLLGGGDCNDLNPRATPGNRLACARAVVPFGRDSDSARVRAFFDEAGRLVSLQSDLSIAALRLFSYDASGITGASTIGGILSGSPVDVVQAGGDRWYYSFQETGRGPVVIARVAGAELEAVRVLDGAPSGFDLKGYSADGAAPIALDAAGSVHVAYASRDAAGRVVHAVFTPALRPVASEIIGDFGVEEPAANGLHAGDDGTLRAFTAKVQLGGEVALRLYTRPPTGTWTSEQVTGDGAQVALAGAAWDRDDHLHGCAHREDRRGLVYVTDAGGSLVAEHVDSASLSLSSMSEGCVVRISSNGEVHLLWATVEGSIRHARKAASTWSVTTVPGLITIGTPGLDAVFDDASTLWLVVGTRWLARWTAATGWQVTERDEARCASAAWPYTNAAFAMTSDGVLHAFGGFPWVPARRPCHAMIRDDDSEIAATPLDGLPMGRASVTDLTTLAGDDLLATWPADLAESDAVVFAVRDHDSGDWARLAPEIVVGAAGNVIEARSGVTSAGRHVVTWVDWDRVVRVASAPTLGAALSEELLDPGDVVQLPDNERSWAELALVTTSSSAWLALCTAEGLLVFERGATSWSREVVDDTECQSVQLTAGTSGALAVAWQHADRANFSLGIRDGEGWTIHPLPAWAFDEAPAILGALPGPLALIGAWTYMEVPQPGTLGAEIPLTAPYGVGHARAFMNAAGSIFGGFERGAVVIIVP